MSEQEFNPEDARTWDARQNAIYEVGHQEGESCRDADWHFAFMETTDGLDASPDPFEAANYVHHLELVVAAARRVADMTLAYEWLTEAFALFDALYPPDGSGRSQGEPE